MASGDQFMLEIAQQALLSSLGDPAEIEYRQEILADSISQPAAIRELYDIAVQAVTGEKKIYLGIFAHESPDALIRRSVQVLEFFVGLLRALRAASEEHADSFRSAGLRRFSAMLSDELSDEHLAEVDKHLRELRFRRGVLMTAGLGTGNRGTGYVLRRIREQGWVERMMPISKAPAYSFQVPARDENGFRALSQLQDRGMNLAANALSQSTDHILGFFQALRSELAFYVGNLNLRDMLDRKGGQVCFPVAVADGGSALAARGLYDAPLALHTDATVTGNDVDADGKALVMITGANQGGKSTFLRSLGVAYLMMQAGMFVPARSFRASVRHGVFTHYRREEDAAMESGKLDEELSRMSEIVDQVTPGCIVLCNESFASTNEREGAEIARQIVRALLANDITVLYVTHLFDLAHPFYLEQSPEALFLRAQRQADGQRSFKIAPGEPLPTSYGEDVYRRIFGADLDSAPAS
ncbi:MAG: DNA mismatch repair protein MutS [Actinomycetota bacterium]|nr:DNA mismatch repair protein MutS [Actinomycetota bacterium]